MIPSADLGHSLHLGHVLAAAELQPKDVLLIRHPLSHAPARAAVQANQLKEYTSDQWERFPSHHSYWLTFVGEGGTSARFVVCYRNNGRGEDGLFQLEETPHLADLAWRLVIDWGPAAVVWRQNGLQAHKKPVVAIAERVVAAFPGFSSVILDFDQLSEVVGEPRRFAEWHVALASVNAVYLIVDSETGKQYVGSAYGDGGLLGRWKSYVETRHGGNKLMIAELAADPLAFTRFQFSILQILSRTATPEEVVGVESLYKRKLRSQAVSLNAN